MTEQAKPPSVREALREASSDIHNAIEALLHVPFHDGRDKAIDLLAVRRDKISAALSAPDDSAASGWNEALERAAMLHESVNPASDEERVHRIPGAGAMGAVIEYRDKIRGLKIT
jgi:hypothetical protein